MPPFPGAEESSVKNLVGGKIGARVDGAEAPLVDFFGGGRARDASFGQCQVVEGCADRFESRGALSCKVIMLGVGGGVTLGASSDG
jgi:hypothetical protein